MNKDPYKPQWTITNKPYHHPPTIYPIALATTTIFNSYWTVVKPFLR